MNDAASAFATLARDYVGWSEGAELNSEQDTAFCLSILSRLYAAGLDLPTTDGEGVEQVPEVPKDDLRRVLQRFTRMPFQYYFEIYEPVSQEPEEPVTGDLFEDLTEIYSDLRAGLEAYDSDNVPGALFWWRNSFGFHWGRHLTSALRSLHCYETRA